MNTCEHLCCTTTGDNEILSQIRLTKQFPSGYRQTVISTTLRGDLDRVLCRGEHEVQRQSGKQFSTPHTLTCFPCLQTQIWWVQRTRYNFVIEFKKNFFIETPSCDWDEINDRAFVFTTLSGAISPDLLVST